MSKYLQVIKNTWSEMVTYRVNFLMWRVRMVLQFLTIYLLWAAIMPKENPLFGYTYSLMLTYILGTALLSSLVFASRSYEIGDDINQGNLSNFLLRPLNYFLFWLAKDVGDKAMNIIFSIVELTIIFLFVRPPFFIQTSLQYLTPFLLAVGLALILWFIFNILIGLIGFWSEETWAPRFILMIVISFSAGGLFPLDILPSQIFSFLQFLPFSYLLYFPLKIYLGQLNTISIVSGFFIALVWIVLLYFLTRTIWLVGLKTYTAAGR